MVLSRLEFSALSSPLSWLLCPVACAAKIVAWFMAKCFFCGLDLHVFPLGDVTVPPIPRAGMLKVASENYLSYYDPNMTM